MTIHQATRRCTVSAFTEVGPGWRGPGPGGASTSCSSIGREPGCGYMPGRNPGRCHEDMLARWATIMVAPGDPAPLRGDHACGESILYLESFHDPGQSTAHRAHADLQMPGYRLVTRVRGE